MMNCDEAFDALTEAVGRASAELEWHLEHCPRCRQMQEVLSPALELFDGDGAISSLEEEFSRDGGAAPFLTPEVLRVARRRAAELLAKQPRVEVRKHPRMVVSWVAALVTAVAVIVGGVALIPGSSETAARRSPSEASLAGCLWTMPAEERLEDETSRAVVMSCVSCHLGRAVE